MPFFINLNDELQAKQHINLSAECWRCLNDDVISFSTKEEKLTRNGLLNRIVINYWEDAEASIGIRLAEAEKLFDASMLDSPKDKIAVRNYLLKVKEASLRSSAAKASKGKGEKFRLNRETIEILGRRCNEDKYYDGSIGKYLHALYEEYASLSYSERELIVYKDKVNTVNDAIELGRCIELRLGNAVHKMRPYKIMRGDRNGLNYIVGYAAQLGSRGERVVSYRLSKAYDIREVLGDNGRLTADECVRIEEEISAKGVAYLAGKIEEIKVRLTPDGVKTFASKITSRPAYTEKVKLPDGGAEYTFRCTAFQAKTYFSSFGKDAEVLAPEQLRKDMKKEFRAALQLYK